MRLTRRDVWRLGVAGTISGVLPGAGARWRSLLQVPRGTPRTLARDR